VTGNYNIRHCAQITETVYEIISSESAASRLELFLNAARSWPIYISEAESGSLAVDNTSRDDQLVVRARGAQARRLYGGLIDHCLRDQTYRRGRTTVQSSGVIERPLPAAGRTPAIRCDVEIG